MTDQRHRPEPWRHSNGYIFHDKDVIGAVYEESDRAHIVACVNALAGKDPDGVAGVVEALRAGIDNDIPMSDWIKMSRAALAKLEGKR